MDKSFHFSLRGWPSHLNKFGLGFIMYLLAPTMCQALVKKCWEFGSERSRKIWSKRYMLGRGKKKNRREEMSIRIGGFR